MNSTEPTPECSRRPRESSISSRVKLPFGFWKPAIPFRDGWPKAAICAWLLVPSFAFLSACAELLPHLEGFPGHEGGPEEVAEKTLADLEEIHESLLYATPTQVEGVPAPDDALYRRELEALANAYLAVGNEGSSVGYFLDVRRRSFPSLILYPSLVTPHIAEPVASSDGRTMWTVPVILNRHALEKILPGFGSIFMGDMFTDEVDESTDQDIRNNFAMYLVPHPPPEDVWERPGAVCVDTFVQRPTHTVPLRDDAEFTLPDARPDTRGLVLSIPRDSPELRTLLSIPRDSPELIASVDDERRSLFVDLRLFPRIDTGKTSSNSSRRIVQHLRLGRWPELLNDIAKLHDEVRAWSESGLDLAILSEDLLAVSRAIGSYRRYFQPLLEPVEAALWEYATSLSQSVDGSEASRTILQASHEALRGVIENFLSFDPSPAPILLDLPARKKSFSFVVAADLQYETDMSAVRKFLHTLDPNLQPHDDTRTASSPIGYPQELLKTIQAADFVVLAGDLGDGAGVG